MRSLITAFTLALGLVASAHAGYVTVDFTATGFGAGAPAASVTGEFVYTSDSLGGAIQSLQSLNLSIAGHAYTLAEVGYGSGASSYNYTFGDAGSLSVIPATNDFLFIFNAVTHDATFLYSVAGNGNVYQSFNVAVTSAFAVPEPGTLALAGISLLALGVASRKRLSK